MPCFSPEGVMKQERNISRIDKDNVLNNEIAISTAKDKMNLPGVV